MSGRMTETELLCHVEMASLARAAMIADNIERENRGEALAWPGSCFVDVQQELLGTLHKFQDKTAPAAQPAPDETLAVKGPKFKQGQTVIFKAGRYGGDAQDETTMISNVFPDAKGDYYYEVDCWPSPIEESALEAIPAAMDGILQCFFHAGTRKEG